MSVFKAIWSVLWGSIKNNPGTSLASAGSFVATVLLQAGIITMPTAVTGIGIATAVGHLIAGDASASAPVTPSTPPTK